MAGIEKVCEYSGEHYGCDMGAYKRNHIQIHPQFRKEFRGKEHTLYIFKPTLYWQYKSGGRSEYNQREMLFFSGQFKTEEEFKDLYAKTYGCRLVNQYEYALMTPDIQGTVGGCFMNWTLDISAVKRRLKRMLRVRKLNIVDMTHITYFDWKTAELKKIA